MLNHTQHLDDAELERLVFDDEESDGFLATAAHVETCIECRQRLSGLAGSVEFAREASSMLSDYPVCESTGEPLSAQDVRLDFLAPPGHPEMLGRLGRYEIERVIGAGGMGIVLKAFDSELNRPVAIKVLAQHLAHRGAARTRFAREAKAAAAVAHEHVVAIHNVEAERDFPFLVMQFVAGESLQTRVDREGPLETKQILRIGIQAAAGLAAAHEQGVIHRDIKPANILLEHGVERVLITDFGLARTVDDASLTHTGVLAGTPQYMSPEQANGQPTDERTDLFSLGSVLYFMATGHPPFRAERAMGVLNRICHDTHRPAWEVNPDVPDELSDLIDRLLQKKASRRFRNADEVREALAYSLATLQQRPRRRRGRLVRWVRRHRAAFTTVCGATIAAGVVATVLLSGEPSESDADSPGTVQASPAAGTSTDSATASAEGDFSGSFEGQAGAVGMQAATAQEPSEIARLEQRLNRFEALTENSTFAADAGDEFYQHVESLNQRLDRIESDTFDRLTASPQ